MDLFIDVSSLRTVLFEMLYLTFLPNFKVLQIPFSGTIVKGIWASLCGDRDVTTVSVACGFRVFR